MTRTDQVAALATITDEDAGRLHADRARLAAAVMDGELDAAAGQDRIVVPTTRTRRRVRLVERFAIPAAGLLAAAAASVVLLGGLPAGSPDGPSPTTSGPGGQHLRPAALTVTRSGKDLRIVIKDLKADPARYNAELRRRGLDVTLSLAPVPPESVGQFVFADIDPRGDDREIGLIYDKLRCHGAAAADGPCAIGLRVPADYHGKAHWVIGRPMRPGEIADDGSTLEARRAVHAITWKGRTFGQVRAALRQQGVKTIGYRYEGERKSVQGNREPRDRPVDDDTYVVEVEYGAPTEDVILFTADKP